MKCLAVAVRNGQRCKNEAEQDGACMLEAHKRQVAERRAAGEFQEPAEPAPAAAAELEQDPTPIATSSQLDAELAAIPTAPEQVIDDIAAAVAASANPDLEAFDRATRRHLEDPELIEELQGDPAAIDAAAVDGDEATTARRELRSAIQGGQVISASSAKRWLRILVNPVFVKRGKDPLDDDELEEGAQLAAEWLGSWTVETREGRTVLWLATVFGLRFAEELLEAAGTIARFAVGRIRGGNTGVQLYAAAPEPPAAPAAPAVPTAAAPERMPAPAAAAAADPPRAAETNGRVKPTAPVEAVLVGSGFGR